MTKPLVAISLALLLGLSYGAAEASESFEGEVVMKWTKPYPLVVHLFLRGKKMRSAFEDSKEPMTLVDMDKLEIIHFLPGKTYKLDKFPAPTAGSYGAPVKSGKKKVIAGQSCEEWVQKSGYATTRYWVVPGVASSVHPWSGVSAGLSAFEFLRSKDLFPVGMTYEDNKSGDVTSQAEATVFTRKKVDPSIFAMPEGFKKTGP